MDDPQLSPFLCFAILANCQPENEIIFLLTVSRLWRYPHGCRIALPANRDMTKPATKSATVSTPVYLTRAEVVARLLRMKGGLTLTGCAREWGVDVRELSKLIRGDPHRYPSEKLLARLGLGKEQVVWPVKRP